MLSSRRSCPFGLPDEAEDVENVVLVAVGHVFRVATAPMLDAPFRPSLPTCSGGSSGRSEMLRRVAPRPSSGADAPRCMNPPHAAPDSCKPPTSG